VASRYTDRAKILSLTEFGPRTIQPVASRYTDRAKILPLPEFGPRTVQPVASRYTDRAILAYMNTITHVQYHPWQSTFFIVYQIHLIKEEAKQPE
jgi:hypothetical protein